MGQSPIIGPGREERVGDDIPLEGIASGDEGPLGDQPPLPYCWE